MDKDKLPLKVGQLAESRSFLSGYRGAWFRCKIKDFRQRRKEIECALEYTDFPDEKIEWIKLCQKPSAGSRSRAMKSKLMIRPSFPPVYRESQMPDVNSIPEVAVIVNIVWKVGDLVDWWSDNCYWSARITEILGEGKFRFTSLLYLSSLGSFPTESQVFRKIKAGFPFIPFMFRFGLSIDLPLPPVGEGSTYEALSKDLRPSLDWSPTNGWTLPIPVVERECCARLVKLDNQEGSQNLTIHTGDEVGKDAQETGGASLENNASFSSHISARSEQHGKRPLSPTACKETQTPKANMCFDVVHAGVGKSSCSDSVSSSHVRDATAEMDGTAAAKEGCQNSGSLKKMRTEGSIPLNSLCSDTIEAAILDLEELVNRIKWIKGILQLGAPLSNTLRPSWKFLEYRSSPLRK
ncbi:hypothetical protein EZV62_000817 [Acer yangbiense]|uniref:Agenet-like domain-containing protein n=1 Tax=Acer yangbiense TaxID=1000413 RepID=A0A5C7ISZ1_9ROSI|nr:hypothetical protein EZV62_000817 [Acer yangbiense]